MPAFSFKRICGWCQQYEAAQRGEVSDVQPVMARPWESSMSSDAPVTTVLLVLNVMVYAAMVLSGISASHPAGADLIRFGSNFGPYTLSGQYWRLFTHMFVHIGFFHLAFNMWFLYSLGKDCERLLGSVTYTAMYLISGVAGGVASLWWHPYTNSAGASGALFGILGAMIASFKFGEFSMPRALVRANLQNMLWCAGINLAWGLTGGIDNAAHIGGMIAGMIIGALVAITAPDLRDFGKRAVVLLLVAGAVGGGFWWVQKGEVARLFTPSRAALLIQQGKFQEATAELEMQVKRNPKDMEARFTLGSMYLKTGRAEDAMKQDEWLLANAPKNSEIRSVAASRMLILVTGNDVSKATVYFSDMAKRDPSDALPHRILGELAASQKRDDVAVAEYQKSISLNANDSTAYIGLGRVLANDRRYDEAIDAYKKAIALVDDDEDEYGYKAELASVEKLKADAAKAK